MKKKVTALLLTLVVALSLPACAGSGSPQSTSSSTSTAPQETSIPGNGENLTITFWHGYPTERVEKLNQMVAIYEEEHPGITIEHKFVAEGDAMLPKVQTAVLSNQQPDLLWGYPTWTGPLVSTGKLLAVDDLIGELQEDIPSGLWDVGKYDDKLYSIPIETGTLLLVYNKDMFEEAGISKVPTTWEELEEVCEKLNNDQHKAISLPIKPNERTTWAWMCFLGQTGGRLLTDDNKSAGFTREQGLEALQYYTSFYEKGYASVTSGDRDTVDPFTIGTVAMTIETQRTAQAYMEKNGINTGVALLPSHKEAATALGSNHYYLFDNGDPAKVEAVIEFVKWMATGENQADWSISTGYVPVSDSAATSQLYQNYLKDADHYLVATESIKYGVARPPIEQYPTISDAISSTIEAIVYGQMSCEAGIDAILASIDKNLP